MPRTVRTSAQGKMIFARMDSSLGENVCPGQARRLPRTSVAMDHSILRTQAGTNLTGITVVTVVPWRFTAGRNLGMLGDVTLAPGLADSAGAVLPSPRGLQGL